MAGGVQIGLTLQNFTRHPMSPDVPGLVKYAQRAEELGFESLWAWDHLLLGSANPFPVLDSLTLLSGLALATKTVQLGTGILVLPLRNPVELAKVTSTIDHLSNGRLILGVASGWYRKEFDAAGVPFKGRGLLVERNLDILRKFWSEHEINGESGDMMFRRAVMLPKPIQEPGPVVLMGGYVDRVLKRVGTLADGWLTYFYKPEDFAESWGRVRNYAEAAGRDPDSLRSAAQLPICVAPTYEEADTRIREFAANNFDEPEWSKTTIDSAIRGTVDDCIEQLTSHVTAGVQHLILVPWEYRQDQVDVIAQDIMPAVRAAGS
jgi:probable F420-dependent oxidoreductase